MEMHDVLFRDGKSRYPKNNSMHLGWKGFATRILDF